MSATGGQAMSALEQARARQSWTGMGDDIGPIVTHDSLFLAVLADRVGRVRGIRTYRSTEDLLVHAGDLRVLADLARDAATYGWPVAPAERLRASQASLPTARATDPRTSHEAGATVSGSPKAGNMLGALLIAYCEAEVITGVRPDAMLGLTSEEAADLAGVSRSSEYAKRCSDLNALGYLRPVFTDGAVLTRPGRSGRQRMVFVLTDAGRTLARQLDNQA